MIYKKCSILFTLATTATIISMLPAESSRLLMVRSASAAAAASSPKTAFVTPTKRANNRALLLDPQTSSSSSSSRRMFASVFSRRNNGFGGERMSSSLFKDWQHQQTRLASTSQNVDESKQNSTQTASNNNNDDDDIAAAGPRAPTPPSSSFDASSVLAIDPTEIQIVRVPTPAELEEEDNNIEGVDDDNDDDEDTHHAHYNGDISNSPASSLAPDLLRQLPFVGMFRGSANYIANHRGTLAVYHIPGGLLDDHLQGGAAASTKTSSSSSSNNQANTNNEAFRDLMNDIALTWLLGMKIVLVVGCRHQIEKRLAAKGQVDEKDRSHGLRVTDEETLRIVKEEAGYVRFEVERQLARSLRMQGSGASASSSSFSSNSRRSHPSNNGAGGGGYDFYDGNVVSGNFYSAQPFGILNGIDYKYTGFVRRVEVEKIRQLHNSRDICLLTTLGVSPSGEVFNVNSECLAASVAGALEASKIIFFTEHEMELRHKTHGNKIQSLRLSDARRLLEYTGISCHKKGFVTMTQDDESASASGSDGESGGEMERKVTTKGAETTRDARDMLLRIGWSIQAIEQGVKRAHIISPKFGAVLQELYTRDGSGMLVSGDLYEGIRRATVHDVSGIYELISPLIQAGTLIDRPKAALEKDIDMYYVYTRDNHIVACGQLKIFEQGFAEIGCLVVNGEYRARGRGDAMLGYLERLGLVNGCSSIFVLSTQTMEWFLERGFDEVTVDRLPPSRQAMYNHKRKSKIYMKKIESARDLDASELWWNR